MRRGGRAALLAFAMVWMLAGPASGTAHASVIALVRDCVDDEVIEGVYSAHDYAGALAQLPTDVAEYLACRDVIRHAQLALAARSGRAGGGRRGGGGGLSVGGASAARSGLSSPSPAGAGYGPTSTRADAELAATDPATRAAVERARHAPASVAIDHTILRPDQLPPPRLAQLGALPRPLTIVLAGLAGSLLLAVLWSTGSWAMRRWRPSRVA